jgi:hypothetical protein
MPLTPEQIEAIETRIGRKLTKDEIFRDQGLFRKPGGILNQTSDAAKYSIVPFGRLSEEDEEIAKLKRKVADEASMKMSPTERQLAVLKQHKADRLAKEELEQKRKALLETDDAKSKVRTIKNIIESAKWDHLYSEDEYQSLLNAQRQITEGCVETGIKMVEESLRLCRTKEVERRTAIEAKTAEIAKRREALANQQAELENVLQ